MKYHSPKDEYIRSLDRSGRGATINELARRWGLNRDRLLKQAKDERWEDLREEYLTRLNFQIQERTAKSYAEKLVQIDEDADKIYTMAFKRAKQMLLDNLRFCAKCKTENPQVGIDDLLYTCIACGHLNTAKMREVDFQYLANSFARLHEARRKIYGGDATTQGQVDRSQFAEQRALYEWDKLGFAKAFFPHLVPDYFNQVHLDSARQFREAQGQRGIKEVIAAPRGYAKTTFDVTIDIIHDCVYEHEKFILVVSSTSTLSIDKVKAIRDEMETNALLKMVYGDMKGPKWNQDDFITSTGVRVLAVSPKTQVRGLNDRGNRPTKIVLDDAENSEHVQTMLQREKMRKWFYEDISKLGTRHSNIKMVGTSLHPESLLEDLFRNPGFRNRRYRAVIEFADESSQPLWEEWRKILIDISNPRRMEMADAFYKEHEAEMIKGAKVLWPERESYVDLMKMRLFEGNTAFQMEKQNNPMLDDRFIFDMDMAARFELGIGRLIREDRRVVMYSEFEDRIAAFLDPVVGDGKESDFAACPIVARDKSGFMYVLDCYLAQYQTPSMQINAVVDLLWKWKVPKMGIEANGFQSLLVSQLKEAIARKAIEEHTQWSVQMVPVTNLRAKPTRISTMEPAVSNRWLWFNKDLPKEYFQQFARFRPIPDAGFDDAPDATEGAIRVLNGLG